MPWRNESDLQNGFSSYEEKFKDIETEILPNISNHDCFYGVFEDLINTAYGLVDEYDTDDSSSEFGMLNSDLLDLDSPVQGNVVNIIGPASSTVEDTSVSREEFCTLLTA